MVDSAKGITNLHAPNDVIVDASMPAMIRVGGKMYGPDGKLKDTKAVMPESTYARIYQEVIDDCLQMFGGYGYMLEYPVARAFMDARVQRIYAGTNEIMKVIIAKQMGL